MSLNLRSSYFRYQPDPDFTKSCHMTLNRYSCGHEKWSRTPRVVHVPNCPFGHPDRHRLRCQNMAKIARISPVWNFCADCLARCGVTVDDKKVEEDTAQKANGTQGMNDGEGSGTDHRSVSSCSHVAVKAAESEPGSVQGTPSEASATSEERSPLDTPGESSSSDVKEPPMEEDGAALERSGSAGSWVEVEHTPGQELEDADQGLLKQRQKDRTPSRRWWFSGRVCAILLPGVIYAREFRH